MSEDIESKGQVIKEMEETDQHVSEMKEGCSGNKSPDEAVKENLSRILVVDDALIELEMLTNILTNHGYKVSTAARGNIALNIAPIVMPDLILLDVKMPDMDGYEVCRRLKSDKQNSEIPIIFISALDETDDIVKGFNAGGVDFIIKPFQPAEVIARVETHLTLRILQKQLEAQNIRLRQEISDRRKAERTLWEKEAHYRAIVESFEGYIYICSKDYRVEFMNERFIKRTGYDGTGEICYQVIHDRDSICPWCVNSRVFKGETVRWEVQSPKDNRWMYVVNTPLYHEDGSVSKQSMILDITDRKKVEEELQTAHNNLERLVDERTSELRIKNRQLEAEIEERRKVEESLRESEEKYRSVVDHIGIGIAMISPHMEILALNNQMKKWFPNLDISKMPICYKSFNSPPRETACSYCPTYETLKDGQVHESITDTPSGQDTINYRIISSPVKDRSGKIIAAIEMVDDITESKRIQEKLRESEAYYRTIFETTGTATMIVERDNSISLVNTEYEKMSGYTKEEIEGKKYWTEFIVKDDLEMMQEYHSLRRINPKAAPRNYDFRFIDRAGSIRNAHLTIEMIPGTEKSVASLLDITNRKKAEESLRESEQRLSDIIDFLPDATFAIDSNGYVIAWNRGIEEMTGTKSEDILGKGDYEYAIPFYGVRRPILIDLVFKIDEGVEKEYSFFKKEGHVFLAEGKALVKDEIHELWAKASPLYDSRGNIVGAIESIRDITERRTAEKALKNRERELEMKTRNLEELNTALKVLLKQREDDRNEIEKRTMANVKQLIIPYIEKLKKGGLDAKDMAYLTIVESNLNDIISPFSHGLSTKYMNFTPKELQIAHLIREGKTTKEIAELLNTSPGTIDFHRNNIRNKLNLKNRRSNLRSYLLTLS